VTTVVYALTVAVGRPAAAGRRCQQGVSCAAAVVLVAEPAGPQTCTVTVSVSDVAPMPASDRASMEAAHDPGSPTSDSVPLAVAVLQAAVAVVTFDARTMSIARVGVQAPTGMMAGTAATSSIVGATPGAGVVVGDPIAARVVVDSTLGGTAALVSTVSGAVVRSAVGAPRAVDAGAVTETPRHQRGRVGGVGIAGERSGVERDLKSVRRLAADRPADAIAG
jgi:hypothetical protein